MTSEFISTGDTYNQGRIKINTLLSGNTSTLSTSGISFSNIHINNTLTANTINATTITSGNISLTGILSSNLAVSPNWELVNLTGTTTSGSIVNLFHNNAAITDSTFSYDLMITARQVDGIAGTLGDSKYWKTKLLIEYQSIGLNVLIGSATTTTIASSTGASTWGIVPTAYPSFPGSGLQISISGETNKTIIWSVHGICSSIVYTIPL